MVEFRIENDQIIHDAFYMPKSTFTHYYKQYFTALTETEAEIIWLGIREKFEHIKRGLIRTDKLDVEKLAKWKMSAKIELNVDEQKSLIKDDRWERALDIKEDIHQYKWKSDKIRQLWKESYTQDEMLKLFQGDITITLSYLLYYKPK